MRLWGLLAEFESVEELLAAARAAREAGWTRFEAHSPHPVEGLDEAVGFTSDGIPALVLAGGVLGAAAGYGLQYWVTVWAYPLNVGGRPEHPWPAFIPVTFELTILGAALAAVIGMFALNGLPRPHHPLFAVPRFERATRDRFFLVLEAADPLFEPEAARRFLESLRPAAVEDVPE